MDTDGAGLNFLSDYPDHPPTLRPPRTHARAQSMSMMPTHAKDSPNQSIPIPAVSHRVKSPSLRHRTSSQASISSEHSEIVSPIPRRHHYLQASESRHWLPSPSISPVSTRGASPLPSSPTRHRIFQRPSFASVLEQDHANASPAATTSGGPRVRFPDGEHQPTHETSMSRRWVRWMHKNGMKHWVLPVIILASTWVKWAIGLGPYSGMGTPPMYGDYEAQRHWMELTLHLPVHRWYTYDLEYWGLDYPPLTAYVSWLCGKVGSWLDRSWFELDQSRGIESYESKNYMRATVLFFDAIVYLPAIVLFTRIWQGGRSSRTQHVALLSLVLQPSLLLIDFGHFQYNSVMLGLTLLAINFFASGRDLLGAICFTLSLGFKQMALYYAPAVGTYLLAKCLYLGPVEGHQLFIRLALVTFASFTLLFLPFLPPLASPSTILQPIVRIFPFARGLFEDKVANFWCATNVVFKWKIWFSQTTLVKISSALTALGFLPSVVGLFYSAYKHRLKAQGDRPKQDDVKDAASAPPPFLPLLPYALLSSSMSFFLFSFQVHEKTILVPLLPLTLLLAGSANDSETFELGALVNNVGVFSMWPLLKRDGLGVQYIALLLLWNRLIGHNPFRRPRTLLRYLSLAVYSTCLALHFLELVISPPARFPDLFSVLNVLVSTPIFVLTWLWSIKRGIEVGWAAGGLGSAPQIAHTLSSPNFQNMPLAPVLKHQASSESTSTVASAGMSRGARRFSSLSSASGRLKEFKDWEWSDGTRVDEPRTSAASSLTVGREDGRARRRSVQPPARGLGNRQDTDPLRTASANGMR